MPVWYWRQPSWGRLGEEQSTWLTWYRGLGAMVSTSVLGTLIFQVAASEMTAVREASLASPAPASM